MIKAIWTLLKISVVVGVCVWIADRPGTIAIDWMDYKFTFHVGFFFLAMLVVVVLGILIFSIIKTILDFPKKMSRYKDITGKEKGMRALAIGMAAVAAGDAKGAAYQAYRAKKFLKETDPLVQLMEAQSARLNGDEVTAARSFIGLLENKDASFLGVRGLLQSALDNGDYEGALELGHKALEQYPKQGWILCVVYDLEIRARNWDSALKVLYRAEKAGAIAVNKANSDRVAMLLAQAEEAKANGEEDKYFRLLNKAYAQDKHFVPTVIRLVDMYVERDKLKAAASLIESAWKVHPHSGLAALWEDVRVVGRHDDKMARVRWFEKLLSFNPESVVGLMALANVLMSEGLWGEARKYLQKAESIRPNVNLYKMWALLEERATHDKDAVQNWLEKAADAPRERVWICSETGRVYEKWAPISDQGLFNTIIWDFPQGRVVSSMMLHSPRYMAAPLLGAA